MVIGTGGKRNEHCVCRRMGSPHGAPIKTYHTVVVMSLDYYIIICNRGECNDNINLYKDLS